VNSELFGGIAGLERFLSKKLRTAQEDGSPRPNSSPPLQKWLRRSGHPKFITNGYVISVQTNPTRSKEKDEESSAALHTCAG